MYKDVTLLAQNLSAGFEDINHQIRLANQGERLSFITTVSRLATLFELADDRKNKIYAWLKAPDYSKNYLKALQLRSEGTGEWVASLDSFKSWEIQPASFLWFYGIREQT